MKMLATVGSALQQVFGSVAEKAAEMSGVIKRQRVFSPTTLMMTFVLGHLHKPEISVDELAVMASQCGASVTPQAVDQRRTPELVAFLEQVFRESLKIIVASSRSLAPVLDRFTRVTLIDGSLITLPDSQKDRFAGCGGPIGASQSAVKLQTELELRTGALSHMEIEQGKSPDAATCRQRVTRGKGSLRISDLGYFCLAVFAAMTRNSEYFLSRLQFGTTVLLPDGTALNLLRWLEERKESIVDRQILLGLKERLPCRIIAWRMPADQAARRRQKLRADVMRKKSREPSAERLAWCDWTILVMNVSPPMLTPQEAIILYRARWQIELLFKRWKSGGLVAELTGSTDTRTMVSVWSRLIACVVQHWLIVATVWGDASKSLDKTAKLIRDFANQIATNLWQYDELIKTLAILEAAITKTCSRNKRKKPGTFEMLNNPQLLDFELT
jgi:hypothetical protein